MKVIAGLQSACSVRVADARAVTIGNFYNEESASAAQPKVQAFK